MKLSSEIPEIEGRLGSAGSDESEAVNGDGSPRRRSGPALAQPASAAARAEVENGDPRWPEHQLRNDNRWPRTRAEELEQRLRRRTIVLGSALVLSGLIAVTAVGVTVVRSPDGGPEPLRTAAFEPAPPASRAADALSASVAKVEQASGIGPPRADQQPAVVAQGNKSGEIDRPAEAAGMEAAAEQRASGPAQVGAAERLKRLREAARQSGGATTALRSTGAPVRQQPAPFEQQPQRQGTAAGRDVDVGDTSGDLQTALAAIKQRVEELETAKAEYEARIAELRAELEDNRAEAPTLDERLAASRRGIERLNALPTTATATGPAKAGAGGSEADREAAGASSHAAAPAAAGSPAPETTDDEASTGGEAASYTTAYPVNLRAGPSNAAEVLAVVEPGDVVRRIGRERGWLQVSYTARRTTAVTGWMHSRHLRPVGAPSQGGGTSARADG